jgi:uncharacterized protein
MIDMHMHIGKLYIGEAPLTPEYLLGFMDSHGIERACIQPIESPEETHYYVTTDYVIDVCSRFDRLIPFCNLDPRHGPADTTFDSYAVLKDYADRGVKGFGECMSGLWIDDPRYEKIYDTCGELGLPIVFHMDTRRMRDDLGLHRMERMAHTYPDTIFVGHAQHFWAEISGDCTPDDFSAYPNRPITPGGATVRLLRDCPNIYADISAGSGFNAFTRDPEFGYAFLNEFQDKLMFGTDICRNDQEFPIFDYLADARSTGKLSETAYRKIATDNAMRVFNL